MNKVEQMLKIPGTIIVDVRTPGEYMGGHVAGSINLPLNEIPGRLAEFKDMKQVVLCCASGARSMSAAMALKQQGVECVDGGPWTNVNFYCNNN
jgi:rhodanese-related sulfurtransferase